MRLLIERRPTVVPKAELYARISPETVVVEANLNVLIAEIRRALDDDPKSPRFVRTAHRVGYAFKGSAIDLAAGVSTTGGGVSMLADLE